MDRIALAFSPLRDAPPRDILDWSRRAETLGFAGIFVPESFNDSLAYAQAVAGVTSRAKVGTAITNVYLRHPTLLAQQAAAVQELSGGRLLLGLGVGDMPEVSTWPQEVSAFREANRRRCPRGTEVGAGRDDQPRGASASSARSTAAARASPTGFGNTIDIVAPAIS